LWVVLAGLSLRDVTVSGWWKFLRLGGMVVVFVSPPTPWGEGTAAVGGGRGAGAVGAGLWVVLAGLSLRDVTVSG
jgi:hypothetical protein